MTTHPPPLAEGVGLALGSAVELPVLGLGTPVLAPGPGCELVAEAEVADPLPCGPALVAFGELVDRVAEGVEDLPAELSAALGEALGSP